MSQQRILRRSERKAVPPWVIGASLIAVGSWCSWSWCSAPQLPLDRPCRGRAGHQAARPEARKDDQLVALNGEAGYQADLLMPGLRFKLWPDLPGRALPLGPGPARPHRPGHRPGRRGRCPTGAKSAVYRPEFGSFADLRTFLDNGGQRGVQRPVLPPGTTAPIHPIGFVVITSDAVFGKVVSDVDAAGGRPGRPGRAPGRPHHPAGRPRHRRRRDHARGPAVGRHRQPHRRVLRRHRDGAVRHGLGQSRSSRPCCARRTTCTTTTRTTRRSWTTAAASACSTTRSSTARTCSTRSW